MIWLRRPGTELLRSGPTAVAGPATPAGREADPALAGISLGEYRSLVRLATLLLYDASAAEAVVQDAFVAMLVTRRRHRDTGEALSYLRREVVSRSRRAVGGRTVPGCAQNGPGTGPGATAPFDHSAFRAALRSLPGRQREAIVLRYYAGLPEAETAAAMGIGRVAVRRYTMLGMTALKPVLEHDVP